MRLTLRTMLAYLDDILDPADAQDLGHKIEESEFASSLVGRIRDASRRLRLGAPKLTGKGMGLDPNTVAEYLDNTLSVARVPEFEKICLESDMHLAEVACSHQILALVLGEPADVNPASRQRMYKLLPHAQADTFTIAPASDRAELRHSPRPKAHVPDYLREDRPWFSGWMKVAAAILVLAGLTAAVWMAVGPADRQPIAQLGDNQAAGRDETKDPTKAPAKTGGSASSGAGASNSVGDAAGVDEPANSDDTQSGIDEVPGESEGNRSPKDPRVESSIPPDSETKATPASETPTTESDASAATDGSATDGKAKNFAASDPLAPGDGSIPSPFDTAPSDNADAPPKDLDSAPPAKATREPAGRYLSTSEVLLRDEGVEKGWTRLEGQSTVAVDDHLLSLPTFRSTVALSAGVTVQLVGDTEVRIKAPDATGVPELDIAHGRLVLMTAGRPGAQLRIDVGELRGTITLVDAASVLGIEVRPVRAEGTDPATEPPVLTIDLYVASGEVIWVDAAEATPISLTGPRHWSWPTAVPEEAVRKIDEPWILGEDDVPAIEKRASKQIAQSLTDAKSARLQFKEFADARQSEIRSLAVRCLASLGDYDAFVKYLGDESKRGGGWDPYVDVLRSGLARGPESAAQVKSSLDRLRGGRSELLYRMLWGYSEAQLKSGSAIQLAEYLDDQNLDIRVMAFCTLERLAGKKGYAYRPTDNPKARQPYLQKWRKWAETYEPSAPTRAVPSLP